MQLSNTTNTTKSAQRRDNATARAGAQLVTLLGFYQSREAAEAAVGELRRLQVGRTALVYQTNNGPTAARSSGSPPAVARYGPWVLRNEFLVLLVAAARDAARGLDTLRQGAGGPPITFVFGGDDLGPAGTTSALPRNFVPVERLGAEAERLASALGAARPGPHAARGLLARLRESEQLLERVREDLVAAGKWGQAPSQSVDWLLDNSFVIQGHIDDVAQNLPPRFLQTLPLARGGQAAGLPRVYAIASALLEATDARLDQNNLDVFLRAFQRSQPLTLGELWAIPLLLRLRLIEYLRFLTVRVVRRQRERVLADFWASRLLSAVRRDPDRLLPLLAQLAREVPDPSPHLADQLAGHLYDEEQALTPVRAWLERKLQAPLAEVVAQEQREQAGEQVSLGNALGSLRLLAQLGWAEVFEAVSAVDAVLRNDPAQVYGQMDFATRDRYRHVVEEIAKRSGASEGDVAAQAHVLAQTAEQEWMRHVGYWLVDDGRSQLEAHFGYRSPLAQRLRQAVRRHPAPVYLGSIGLLTIGFVWAALGAAVRAQARFDGVHGGVLVALGALALLPASELAVGIVNYLVTCLLPPRVLPKMSFKEGVPPECRTLVVVPMMLLAPDAIRTEVERLEIRYLANPDPNLRFGLISDFSDAPEPTMPDDAERLDIVVRGIEALNARYGARRFFLFHRDRTWSQSEERWIGWERKRGKLEQLNAFLLGEGDPGLLRVGDKAALEGVRFVLTLDADTQLPLGTARRLVETLAHPLNRPQLGADGRSVERGYTILQPRVSTSLPSATATFFSRLFTDPSGTDPYTHAVSDVYQDLTGEGSYHGKGIYDLHAFHQVLHDRLPPAHVLSHDLLEGVHVRVGLASDIELFDLFPGDYVTYSNRQHRWVRGDWQIADWLGPTVPGGDNKRHPNPFGAVSRWKIFDNLRRSLLPVATVLLLLVGWFAGPAPPVWSVFALGVLLLPAVFQAWGLLASGPKAEGVALREMGTTLLRACVLAALLPHQAFVALDAIARVTHRRFVTHRLLLEWETAHEAHRRAKNRQTQFLLRMAWIPFTFAAVALLLPPQARLVAEPFLLVWIVSPLLVALLNTPARPPAIGALTPKDQQMLRQIARQTWRFFDDFVGPQTRWLPPDNYQEAGTHERVRQEVAQRTSPTNIGLWLLSILAAHDFGYLTLDGMFERQQETGRTLDTLERYEGHLLNWYDTATAKPLYPRYVSTVDSGNLLGALWALGQGCRELLAAPIVGPQALDGLGDTLALLREKMQAPSEHLATLQALVADRPAKPEERIGQLQSALAPARALRETVAAACPEQDGCVYWAEQVEQQVVAWNTLIDRYLPWMGVLLALPPEGLLGLGDEAHVWRRQALETVPSLQTIASGAVPGMQALTAQRARADELKLPPAVRDWLERLDEAHARAQWLAGEQRAQAQNVLDRTERLADGMNFPFLYNDARHVFATGYNVDDRRRDPYDYDLLASEARLGSFASIARGETPVEHWWALGRPITSAYGQRALLSWSGTMFEYLMPLLLTRSYANSLLDQACHAAVACQIAYAQQRGVPWGISEAAHSALDARQVYQYYAFGVPGLARKRGQEESLVVTPYATALALPLNGPAAVRNLARLDKLGMRGAYGYYESIDYTRQSDPDGGAGVIVQAYMAHHQGMIFIAIGNALLGSAMQNRFHRDPRVRASESLLHERIPTAPAAPSAVSRQDAPAPPLSPAAASGMRQIDQPEAAPVPQTHLLSNGTYHVMVTAAGGGYSRYQDVDVTRWRADTTRDASGSFVYVRDTETGAYWSATQQPVQAEASLCSALFTAEKAEFRRRGLGIETLTEVVVSPEDDVEVRRITLTNRSQRTRTLELTSYAEIALAPHNADRAHPAFSKLFLQTEALPGRPALLAGRRPRSSKDAPPWAVHVVAVQGLPAEPPAFETDRARFLGRGRTPQNPIALEGGMLSGTVGAVLDPVFSLRRSVTIAPGERVQIAFVTGATPTRNDAVALAEKYGDLQAAHRALEMAWTHAQLELRHLRLQSDEAQRFQQLASHLLYPHARLRSPAERLRKNTRGQSHLWAYGISGDLPLVVVTIDEIYDAYVVREILQAHTYWRLHGLRCDLVILNQETSTYEQPLMDQLRRLVAAHSQHTGIDQPGGVFLRPAASLPEEDRTLLLSVARVVLVAARGPLEQQLGVAEPGDPPGPPLAPSAGHAEEPSPPLPFLEMPYFNGLGGFTQNGEEYAVYLGPGDQTPLPWINVMANPNFGTLVSESGAGFSWAGNSQSNRLTPWSNDPISDPIGDAIYIRDDQTNVLWTPTPLPIREQDAYRTRHGQGYTVCEHNSHALEQELVTFVPVDDNGGAPIRVQRLRLINRGSHRRRLTVTGYAEWVLGADREDTQMHVVTTWDAQSQSLHARNAYHPDFGSHVAFASVAPSSPTVTRSWTADRAEFLGRGGSPTDPAALRRTGLAGRAGAGLDPCAALQVTIELEPGAQTEVVFLLGQAPTVDEARALVERFRDPVRVEQAFRDTRAWWDNLLNTIQVETPDKAVDFLLNRWLLYQDLSCRIWGRSAFYQSGGAFGFRDQLQDVCALVYARPILAREQILRSAARQFIQGDVQHWWHPPGGAGVRTRISDDLLWLPFVTAQYVRVTGDAGILDEMVPFLEGKILEDGEHEAFFAPTVSAEQATLLEHCRRALEKGTTAGPHGLPLIGGGDWNDGMNRVGVEGRGESVWLAWFLIHALDDFAELLRGRGEEEAARAVEERAAGLAQTVEEQAWDGAWYRRAYFDDGTPLGSHENDEARIDSLPQSWATICGRARPERAEQALASVRQHLVHEQDGGLLLLFTPPLDQSPQDPGYIKGYPPGVRENGGQYTHGSLWTPLAFARRGDGDTAVELLSLMNPVEHARLPHDVARYKVEPYVVAADVYALPGHVGRGGWTWYTGSAGWMYRVWLEEVLGFALRGDTLTLDPRIRSSWDGFTLRYRYHSAHYLITVANPDHVSHGVHSVELDGAPLPSQKIPLQDDGAEHTVHVRLGK